MEQDNATWDAIDLLPHPDLLHRMWPFGPVALLPSTAGCDTWR